MISRNLAFKIRTSFTNLVFVALTLFCVSSRGAEENSAPPIVAEQSFEQNFKSGVQSYQKKDYETARDFFSKSLAKDPNNLSALTNLALTEFQLGKKGHSVALLRKAASLDPDFSVPKAALKFILPQLEVKEIPHEIQFWEGLRSQFLAPVPLNVFLILSALTLFASGWLLIGFWGARQRALKEDSVLPAFPTIGTILFAGFITVTVFLGLKFYDYQIPRATVVADKIAVLSAPDEKAPALFDLFGGLEVIVLSSSQDWVQVNYPGALSGWLPKNAILPTSGKSPW